MKGIISNVTGAIDIVARNRYRESATACGVRRKKASDGMIRLVSLLILSFLMSFVGNSTALAGVKFAQNYEAANVAADWTSSNTDRYTVAIAGDDSNHYLQVSSVGNGNNGTSIVSNSFNGVLDDDASEFTLSFDIQLTPASGSGDGHVSSFFIADGGAGNVLKLLSTGDGSTTWQINDKADQTVTLDKTKWYTFKIEVVSGFEFLTVTDKATGSAVFARQKVNNLILKYGLSKMTFNTDRYWAGLAIDNVKVSTRIAVRNWDFTKATWVKETGFGTETVTINKQSCTYATGDLDGLALQGGTGTGWTVNANGLFQGNGGRNIAILGVAAGDVVIIETTDGTAANNNALSNIVNGTSLNATYEGVCLFEVSSDGTFGFQTIRNALKDNDEDYYIKSISVLREEKPVAIHFSKGEETDVEGVLPEDREEQKGMPFATPVNTSLYKYGYTLTGWNDGENTIACGTDASVEQETTFTSVFRQNTVDRSEATTIVTAEFNNIAWTESGTEKYYVTQAAFKKESQDVAIKVDGKTITVYDIYPSTRVLMPAGTVADYNAADVTVSGDTLIYNGTGTSLVITYKGTETATSFKVIYPRTVKPVYTGGLREAYASDRNGSLDLTVKFDQAVSYQWYSNTTASTSGGTPITGATSTTYTVPTATNGTTFYYCVATNAEGSIPSIATRVMVDDYVTFDFKNWPTGMDTAIGVENIEKGHSGIIQTAKDNIEWPMNPILYPYNMAGYFGRMESSNDIAIVPGTGMKCTLGKAHRPIAIYDVKVGDVIVIKGVNLQATDLINDSTVSINDVVTFKEDRAKGDVYVNDYKTEMTVVITKAGHFIYRFRRDAASENPNVVESIMVLDRFAPTVATDLDGQTHTIARGKTETFTVAGAKHPESSAELSYQWYRSDTDSIQGGTPIEGATDATYTTKENESYYYYCVIRNSETQAACVTTKTTHVQCTPRVSYTVNQETDADVVGEVPPTEIIEIGKKFTIEAQNQLLFKEGYTLKGWMTDSTHVYNFGESYDIVNDIVLYPYFVKNEQQLKKISKNVDVTWEFGVSKGAPAVTWNDSEEHQLVTQQAVSGETQDFTAKITSTGFDNVSATEGYASVADGTKIVLKAKYGTVIAIYAKEGETPSGKLSASDYSKAYDMTRTDNVLSYVYDGGDSVVTVELSAGSYEKMVVRHVPSGMPVFTKNLDDNYYCETGQQITMSIDASLNTTIQWYKNTTKSTTGGVAIPDANSESLTVTRSTDGSDYYYVTVTNNYGTVVSKCAQVDFYSFITLDFQNWDEADAAVYKIESDASIKMRGGSMAYRYLYPYGLAGYLAVQNGDVRGDQPARGLHEYGSGGRYIVWLDLNKGEKVFITSQSNALTLWPDGTMNADGTNVIENAGTYNYTQNGDNTETEIEMLTSGHLYMTLNRGTEIYSIKLPNKYAPVIKKDLEDEYVVAVNSELTLSVDAELPVVMGGQELAYQWYTNKTKSNKGGTAIEGATSASYVINKVNSAAYYYCLISNTGTGAVSATKAAAVGYYVDVNFANNDDDAVGITPKTIRTQSGLPVTIPTNQTLYKKGSTLTTWTAGLTATKVGEQYVPTADVTLTAEFTENPDGVSLAGRDDATTVTWQFGQVNGAAEYTGGVAANVVQLPVKGYNMDLGITMTDGKNNTEDTYTEHGFLAANNGNFTIPVTRNATVSVNVYEAADITINGNAVAYKSEYGEAGNVTFVYTHNDADGDIVLNIGNGHLRSITVDYPAPPTIAVDKSAVSLKIVGDMVQSTTAIVNVTGKYLVPGSTVSITKDAKGVNYTVSPMEITVASDGTVNQQLLITYAGTAVQAETSSVVTITADQYTKTTTTVTYERTVAMGTVTEVVPVTNKTTWDWSSTSAKIEAPYENAYTSFSDVTLGESVTWPAGVAYQNLAGAGLVFANNANNSFEGTQLYFKNTVKGTVEVEFSNISSGAARVLVVNGENTKYTSNSTNHVKTDKIPVKAGGVLIQGRLAGQNDGEQSLRIYKVTFTPDAETPVVTVDAGTSSFTLTTTDSQISDDTNPNKETIYYTLDGTVPSPFNGYKYTVGTPVRIATNYNIKAIAIAPGKNDSEIADTTTVMPVYELTIDLYPGKNGRIKFNPEVEGNLYTLNSVVTVTGYANSGYGLLGWTSTRENIGRGIYVGTDASLEVTINETGNEYWAVFASGEKGTTVYDLENARFYDVDDNIVAGGNVLIGKAGFKSPITSRSISAPSSYPLHTLTELSGSTYTLQYWLDANEKRYDLGTNTLFAEANQTVTLIPVYKQNVYTDYLDTRKSAFNVTWDFRRAQGAHPFTFASGASEIFYSTHAKMDYYDAQGALVKDQVVDIPIAFSTQNSESSSEAISNEDMDAWCTMLKGTKITIPSSYGSKITLASYAKMNDVSKGGTTVNGLSPDNINDEFIEKNEDGAYLYTWTVENNDHTAELVIGNDYSYYQYVSLEMPDAEYVYLDYSSNNDAMGTVKDNAKAVKAELGYAVANGSNVTLTAKRKKYNVLDYWVDGAGNKIYPDGSYELVNGSKGNIGTGSEINGVRYTGVTNETDSCYTISFAINRSFSLQAVFKEKTSYTVNFSAGDAVGVVLPQQKVEFDQDFVMPEYNYNLYLEGYTLKYYIENDKPDVHYEFGHVYPTTRNMRLVPVFEANAKSVTEVTATDGVEAKWALSSLASLNLNSANGIMVTQLAIDAGNKIDVKMDITARSGSIYTSGGVCEVSKSVSLTVPTTKNCVLKLATVLGAPVAVGDVRISKDSLSFGESVSVAYADTMKTQDYVFINPARLANVSVVYKPISTETALDDVLIGNIALSDEKLADLKQNTTINYDYPAASVYDAGDKLPEVTTVVTGGTTVITQATVTNPTATILLQTTGGVTIKTYTIKFNITEPTAPAFTSIAMNGTAADDGGDVGGNQPVSGVITLTFDHAMEATDITCPTLNQTMKATVSGRTISLAYWGLANNKDYNLTIPAETFTDVYGQKCSSAINFKFKTAAATSVSKGLFDFVVTHRINWNHETQTGGDTIQIVPNDVIENLKELEIPYGTLETATNLANAAGGTDRFRIFVPDGEYGMKGNNAGVFRSIPTTKIDDKLGIYGKVDGGLGQLNIYIKDYNDGKTYYTGRTVLARNNVSIVGQSQDKTIIYNDPFVVGIDNTATMKVNANIENTYFQDLTFENRFCNEQTGANPNAGINKDGGGAAAFYDNGLHTICKNVTMKAHEGTYSSTTWNGNSIQNPKSVNKTDNYYEDCQLWGTYYFMHDQGQAWWERPTIVLRRRSSTSVISFTEHYKTEQPWGYVINKGLVKAENATAANLVNNRFALGSSLRNSPAVTFLNTKFDVIPRAEGYVAGLSGALCRLHEYNSLDANGTPLDLTQRTISVMSPATGSDDPVLTADQAADYNLHNVLGGDNAYDPTVYVRQVDMEDSAPGNSTNTMGQTILTWKSYDDALCYFIFRINEETGDTVFYSMTKEEQFLPGADQANRWFIIRAANERGGLGAPSPKVQYKPLATYEVTVKQVGSNPEMGWATVCLPENVTFASIEGMTVYAAIDFEGTTLKLKKVNASDGMFNGRGYIIYAKPGTYTFRGTYNGIKPQNENSVYNQYSVLDGNPENKDVSVGTLNIYTLDYKESISSEVGFYKYIKETIPARKAYLQYDVLEAAGISLDLNAKGGLMFLFDDEEYDDADGIQGVNEDAENADEAIFDLSGRRIERSQMRKGMIYIINGKKVVW